MPKVVKVVVAEETVTKETLQTVHQILVVAEVVTVMVLLLVQVVVVLVLLLSLIKNYKQ